MKLGLSTNLYEVPFIVNETNGTARTNYTINVTFNFDSGCSNKAWNTTARIYDTSNSPVPVNITNITYCVSGYMKNADLVFNITVGANSSAELFLFYSSGQKILPNYVAYAYPTALNYTIKKYPEMTLQSVSVDKLLSLRNLSYDQVAQTLSNNYKFYFEVGK